MSPRDLFPESDCVSAATRRGAPRRSRALLAGVALGVVCLLAAACGGGEATSAATPGGVSVTVPEALAEASAAFEASRAGQGITAAGGTVQAGEPCPPPGSPGAAETHMIAVVTPDVGRLDEIGLGALVFESFEHAFHAYINEVNSFGGINGNCFDFSFYEYGFTNPAEEIGAICAELPQDQPLVLFGFGLSDVVTGCTTIAAQIPTIGLYAQFPEAFFNQTGDLLLVDHGSLEFLLDNGLRTAANAGVLSSADSVGLLYSDDDSAASIQATFAEVSGDLELQVTTSMGVPAGLYGTAVVVIEEQFRNAGGEVFHPDGTVFVDAVVALPPELGELLAGVRGYYLDTATAMRDAGVTTVVATASWDALRNLMRAAEAIGWYPKWLTNDSQISLITLVGTPKAQGLNLVQISSRRAADDPIDGFDRGCLTLRNTDTDEGPFAHRYHTDAWSLLTATCDYLDVVFGAMSRVNGPLTREAFLAALGETDYTAAHGQRLRFTAGDLYGSDSFRVLSADPNCVLNDWGCMRPLTDWLELTAAGGTTTGATDE